MSQQVSDSEIARWALDASDWLWGTVQGAFNEKQTTSQIIVDAVVGMIPLVGDVTAARDLIAVSTRMADDPKKREETMEWVLLVVLVFALIPVIGGVIKGVGRLLIRVAKQAGEHSQALREVIEFLNGIGRGNALTWFRQLDFAAHQAEVLAKFNALMDKLLEALMAIRDKLGWMTPASMKSAVERWINSFRALKAQGAKMIPKAITELNERLRLVQSALYKGELITITPGTKTVVREAEARMIENGPRSLPKLRKGFKANTVADYKHVEGWPDLAKGATYDKVSQTYTTESLAAFSGPMRAIELKPGQVIYRVLLPAKNWKGSPWWTTKLPETAEQWRELLAVLDKFNANNFFVKYTIPDGTALKAWAGKAAEQADGLRGQYLPGGGEQLFAEFPAHIKQEIVKLPALSTGWGKTLRIFGFGEDAQAAIAEIQLERRAVTQTQKAA